MERKGQLARSAGTVAGEQGMVSRRSRVEMASGLGRTAENTSAETLVSEKKRQDRLQ